MIENIIALLLTLILAPIVMALVYVVLEDEIKDFLNKRESALENISKILTPKTPIQKEIQAELEEIKRLEKQKADMKQLDQLRERKERLWEEVNGESLEERILKIDGFETTEEALEYMHNTLKDL